MRPKRSRKMSKGSLEKFKIALTILRTTFYSGASVSQNKLIFRPLILFFNMFCRCFQNRSRSRRWVSGSLFPPIITSVGAFPDHFGPKSAKQLYNKVIIKINIQTKFIQNHNFRFMNNFWCI